MANISANAIDWYVDFLNRKNILPANVAALLRSINAKQLGDSNFRPRPITIKNFTKPQLAAILRLADGSHGTPEGTVTFDTYSNLRGEHTGGRFDWRDNNFRFEKQSPESRFSPLGVVATTLGQFTVGKDKNIRDIYDFNQSKTNVLKLPNGKYLTRFLFGPKDYQGLTLDEIHDRFMKHEENVRTDTPYGRMRNNITRFAHTSSDPDEQKIVSDLPIEKIKKMIGNPYKYDILKKMSKGEMILKGLAAGGITGLPIGAALGTMAGVLSLIDKKKRKKWLKNILLSTAVGAGIGSMAGAAGGGVIANKLHGHFSKQGEDAKTEGKKKKKRREIGKYVYPAVSWGIPALTALGLGLYAYDKGKRLAGKLNDPLLGKNELILNEVEGNKFFKGKVMY